MHRLEPCVLPKVKWFLKELLATKKRGRKERKRVKQREERSE